MKKRKLLSGFILAALMTLGIAGHANAATYTCANVPASITGNNTVGSAGTACSITKAVTNTGGTLTILGSTITDTGAITADILSISGSSTVNIKAASATVGNLDITSTGGSVTTTNLSGAIHVDVNSQGSTGDTNVTGTVTANNGYVQIRAGGLIKVTGALKTLANGNILLVAQKTLRTGAVTGATGFNVDLKANQGAGSTGLFTIGGTGLANGVNGAITLNVGSAGGVIYVTNGAAGSAGDITLTATNKISLTGTVARYIILNAQNGTLNMPTGTLAVDGTATDAAGQIQLLANTVTFADNATLSAKQTTLSGSLHGIAIAATTINYGATALNIIADGNGSAPSGAFAYLLPKNGTTINDGQDVNNLFIGVDNTAQLQGTLNVQGTGLFKMTANGNNAKVLVQAYPIKFTGPVLLQSTGAFSHTVQVVNPGTLTNQVGLTFSGGTTVTLDASGKVDGDIGGTVVVTVDQAQFSASAAAFSFKANGPSTGSGDAGPVYFQSTALTMAAGSTASFASNGKGSGNGSFVTFYPGSNGTSSVTLGNQPGQFAFSATGGSTTGNGGQITVFVPNPADITVAASNAANVSVLGPNGDGGKIFLTAHHVLFTGMSLTLAADGGSMSGNGGEIHISGNGTVSVGTGANAVALSAKAPGTANPNTKKGGTIEIGFTDTLNLNTANFSVAAAGDAAGGIINLHDFGQLVVTPVAGSLIADGSGTGDGGSITVLQSNFSFGALSVNGLTLSANAGTTGNGNGGQLTVSNAGSNAQPITLAGTTLRANGTGTGSGGHITISGNANGAGVDLTQPNTFITALGGSTGPGGVVTVNKVGPAFLVNVVIKDSVGTGVTNTSTFGGSVSLNGVTCQQWLTGYATWPKSYWNCVNPTSPTLTDQLPASVANGFASSIQAQLMNVKTTIYVQIDSTQFLNFFGADIGAASGYTFTEGPGQTVDLAMFENAVVAVGGYRALTANELHETTVHEMGHAIDFDNGISKQTVPFSFTSYVQHDLNHLDAANGGNPCNVDGVSGPFNGVVDYQTGQAFCNANGTLVNPNGIYTNLKNSEIAQLSTATLDQTTFNGVPNVWAEPFAQAFSYQVYANTLYPNYFITTADGLFRKGYYGCAQSVAAQYAGLVYNPTYSCTN